MTIICNGKTYASQKFPVLEYIFNKYNPTHDISVTSIIFTLEDISEGYDNLDIYRVNNGRREKIKKPTSTSNTILDLCRKKRPVTSRLPQSIINLGYDLRKKTGTENGSKKLAGEFVYLGKGNAINSWLIWPANRKPVVVDTFAIPEFVKPHLRQDEGGLFSALDYCDVISLALTGSKKKIFPVQHPLKWQPNEIDGLYMSKEFDVVTLYPVEAKSLATEDDINLDQILGGVQTASTNFQYAHAHIIPLAVQMVPNGVKIAVFKKIELQVIPTRVELDYAIDVRFSPPINAW